MVILLRVDCRGEVTWGKISRDEYLNNQPDDQMRSHETRLQESLRIVTKDAEETLCESKAVALPLSEVSAKFTAALKKIGVLEIRLELSGNSLQLNKQ